MILITGASGQLGTELKYYLDSLGKKYIAVDSAELDITDNNKVIEVINDIKPKVIYHCAAYTAVDAAEDEGKELNYLVNEIGTKNIAYAAKNIDATLVYISTDYVFNGNNSSSEYLEDDITDPQNEYGKAKLLGEKSVRDILDKYYIIRTSWVFGKYGNNFVYTMKKLAETRDLLTIVDDQYGRPTWTKTLAEFMIYLVDNREEFGVYHLSNDNSCTWYEFAKKILEDKNITIKPVTSDQFIQKAKRPKYSIMNLDKSKATGFNIPTWQEALEEFLETIK